MKKIAITEARRLAEQAGAHTVVVFAFTDDQFSAVSYGATKAKCADAAKWLDRIADDLKMGQMSAPGDGFDGGIMQD
jgi:hypothetical protein